MDRSKHMSRIDCNNVAQHRNLMQDIALKKHISMIQREGKLIEKELREISKVRATLMQIRKPPKQRVLRTELQETDTDHAEVAGPGNSVSKMVRATSQRPGKVKVMYSSESTTRGGSVWRRKGWSSNAGGRSAGQRPHQETLNTTRDGVRTNNSSLRKNAYTRSVNGSTSGRFQNRGNETKISVDNFGLTSERSVSSQKLKSCLQMPTHVDGSTVDCSLPPIDTNPPSPKAQIHRVQKKYRLLLPSGNPCEGEHPNRSKSAIINKKDAISPIPPRAETSMTSGARLRRGSIEISSIEAQRALNRVDSLEQVEISLTMEETLRIKGKFRQIGHSIIATALLKGLKSRGNNLSTDAIHNMHKPINLSRAPQEAQKDEEKESEEDTPKTGLSKFRSLTRKTINVNRLVSVRGRSISDPGNMPHTRQSEDDGNEEQTKDSQVAESAKPCVRKLGLARVTRKVMAVKAFERPLAGPSIDSGPAKTAPSRPLMNPAAALTRRRNLVSRTLSDNTHLLHSTIHEEEHALNDATTPRLRAQKSVRFKVEAWD
ncbi:uncharacterized protein LOC5519949 [Nematostella vectensis]|uniref:uncharacterized protein LOC5519949 n=1 Tax=Nematostella vectensis TaxID=45351 RepID=UPI002076E366|nr:uncharacterized protein LOC5519949 [Nematostella vectensis]